MHANANCCQVLFVHQLCGRRDFGLVPRLGHPGPGVPDLLGRALDPVLPSALCHHEALAGKTFRPRRVADGVEVLYPHHGASCHVMSCHAVRLLSLLHTAGSEASSRTTDRPTNEQVARARAVGFCCFLLTSSTVSSFLFFCFCRFSFVDVVVRTQVIPNLICLGVVMATQQFYVIVDLTGGIGGTLLYFIFPGMYVRRT